MMVREGHGCNQEWRGYGVREGQSVVVSLETEEKLSLSEQWNGTISLCKT